MKRLLMVVLLVCCIVPGFRAEANELQTLKDIIAALVAPSTKGRARHEEIRNLINHVAEEEGLNPVFLRALVACESDFNPGAVSYTGAIGLCQLMPQTALQLEVNPYDMEENLRGGSRYIVMLITKYQDVRKALWAYNAGPTRVDAGGYIPGETREYADRVLALYWKLEKERGKGGHHD